MVSIEVLEQLADTLLELRKHAMNQTGSFLVDRDYRNFFIGPYAQPQLFLTPDGALGPFATTLS